MTAIGERLASLRNRFRAASGIRGAVAVVRTTILGRRGGEHPPVQLPLKRLGGDPVWVRPGTTDLVNFADYHALEIYGPPPEVAGQRMLRIAELGSNVGAALTGLAAKYPDARIVGAEPDGANLALAARNVERFGPRVEIRSLAIWDCATTLVAVDDRTQGSHGLIVRERRDGDPPNLAAMAAVPIGDFLDDAFGDEVVDYMHVSIEGTEPRAFAQDGWAHRVRSLRVEAHPYFGYGAAECIAQLEGLGFRAWAVPELPEKWVYAVRPDATRSQART